MFTINGKSYDDRLYKDPMQHQFEFVRKNIFGDCPHAGTIATPYTLCEEMIGKLPDLNDKLALVLFNPEFCMTILREYPKARIVMITGSVNAYCLQKENGFKGIEHMILADPFDFEAVEREIYKYEKYKEKANE